jgi:hypothetical protein
MAIPSTRSISYDALLSLSFENVREGLFDNIFTSASFLSALYGAWGKKARKKKGIRMVNGGERIRCQLLYGKNTTVKSYSGYDQLDVTPQDGITAAFYTWRQIAGSVAISRKEERQNAGESKIRDLLQAKIMQLEMSLRDELNLQLLGKTVASAVWSAGDGMSSGSDVDPLPHLIPKDPGGSVSVGNINQNTYSWWRPKAVDGRSTHAGRGHNADRGFGSIDTFVELETAMRWLYNACGRGAGGSPDIVLADQLTYESYEASMYNKHRFVNDTSGPVSLGYESVRFKGADVIWDEMVPDIETGVAYDSASWVYGTMFFLNTDFIELVIDSATDFITTPFVRPENQDARVAQILAMMNLTCSNRRKQGIIYGMTVPITA